MNTEVKKQIVEAAKAYAADNGLRQEAFADRTGINVSYINALWKGNMHLNVSGKQVEIKELYFKKIAKAIDYSVDPVYWELVETAQYLEMHTEMADAKQKGYMKMLIGESGCGKTYSVDKFCMDFPLHTYRITVSGLHNLNDIINELCDLLDINTSGSRVGRLKKIAAKLRYIKLDGGKPILIIDEAENLRLPAIRMFKALYDAIVNYCSIVLVGTSQLSDKLDALNERNIEGMPQFYRRFKAGRRVLPAINKEKMFLPFLSRVEDEGLKVLLQSRCNNYGELNDYLEPALREADAFGEELTEQFFRDMYSMNRKAI